MQTYFFFCMTCPNNTILHDPALVMTGTWASICIHSPDYLRFPKFFVEQVYAFLPEQPMEYYFKFSVRWIENLSYAELSPVLDPIARKQNSHKETVEQPNYDILSRDAGMVGPEGRDQIAFMADTKTTSEGLLYEDPIVVLMGTKPARSGRGLSLWMRREHSDDRMKDLTQSWLGSDWSAAEIVGVIQPASRMKMLRKEAEDRYRERHGNSRPYGY